MNTYHDITRQIGDQWVEALKRAEEAVGLWSKSAAASAAHVAQVAEDSRAAATPNLPDPLTQLNDAVKEQLPKPSEVVEANFELTERLLAAQKELTLKILSASTEAAEETRKAAEGEEKKPAAKK